ncbi:Ribonuclease H [Citrus sinensis]|uniref:Ribonuclease H n=1 Tax=Citrus sinensis TaxID=2711 RepID=A0ACB8KA21_CITSI|nr:Ribonuclease H [Citrus sinensis]
MGLERSQLMPYTTPLHGFAGGSVIPEGMIELAVSFGKTPTKVTSMVRFIVVDQPSAYNSVLGRPTLYAIKAATSVYHYTLKFPTEAGIEVVRGNQKEARECYEISFKKGNESFQITSLDPRTVRDDQRANPVEDLVEIPLGDDLNKAVKIRSQLIDPLREQLVDFLKEYSDVFAWTHQDMPGIDPRIIFHRLSTKPLTKPVRQKRRSLNAERAAAVKEVDKLLKAKFIKEARYPEWLANVVMVKKANGKWRMCVDFTDLNKACPKDSFPLPRIDQLVDATAGHELLSFMDAYSGYNQIRMHEPDQEKIVFITDRGLYCYKVMPFGLKNARATYQRLVNAMFANQIGHTMEVYVDDMLTKSKNSNDHIRDLRETFDILRNFKMKLNPAKCAFGVASGKFLGFMKGKEMIWTKECEESFQKLKDYLSNPPLVKPSEGESLYMYLAVSNSATSSVLVRDDNGVQRPIYYTSRALADAETRYSNLDKLALALVVSARRLRPYFQAHEVIVLTNQPLKQTLAKPDVSGRLVKWAVELGEFDIQFKPRTSVKGQAVVDFIADFTEVETPHSEVLEEQSKQWTLYVDGASNSKGSGGGLIVITPDKTEIGCALRFGFDATNNEAEYEALLAGLRLVQALGVKNLLIFSDSQLVVNQVNCNYEARDLNMIAYLERVNELLKDFERFEIRQIPREQNQRADALAQLASTPEGNLLRSVPIATIPEPSILRPEVKEVATIDRRATWMEPIEKYLINGELPVDKNEARKFRLRAARYLFVDGELYKRGFSLPLLKCLAPADANYVLREIHEGICGNHSGGRMLAYKAIRQGYFWPTMYKDALELTKKCDKCKGKGQVKFAIVAIDYFTKFGVPHTIITDNGKQFDNASFKAFCKALGITNHYSSPAHPQANGQVEAANRVIKQTLKTKLQKAKGDWPEELPFVLWSYRTTLRIPTGETPFSLAFGTDLVARYYNARVKNRRFRVGDLVLKKVLPNMQDPGVGTLGPNWEGPYIVKDVVRPGTYSLSTLDGNILRHAWNAEHLRAYYQ